MENLQKDFVPYNFALRMKQLGYDEPCIAEYVTFKIPELNAVKQNSSGQIGFNTKTNSQRKKNTWDKDGEDVYVSAPTFSQAFRFFREKHKLHNGIVPYYDYYYYLIKDFNNGEEYRSNDLTEFTYEEAELACLTKLIELLEQY